MESRKEILSRMMIETPDDPFVHYALALELRREGDGNAVHSLRELTVRFPEYVPAWHQLGSWLAEEGKAAEAGEALRSGMTQARAQGNAKALGEMAELLLMLDDE